MQYGKAKKPPSDLAAVAGSSEVLLANVVRGIEGKMEDRPADEERATGESTRPGRVWLLPSKDTTSIRVSNTWVFSGLQIHFGFLFHEGMEHAPVHVLKAKVRIMQEELDQLSSEYYKKVPKSEMNDIPSLMLTKVTNQLIKA